MKPRTTPILLSQCLAAGLAASMFTTQLQANENVIQNSFFPYENEVPSYEGLNVGMTIDQSNVAKFKDVIDPAFYTFIENGWTSITVGETTSFGLNEGYIQATKDALGNVSLGDQVGEISGWQAGRPFPE
ncbi:MAG: DUF1329 domain-containing protein, partial [Marinobacter sp.]